MHTTLMKKQWLLAMGAATLLSACGGGDDYVATTPPQPTGPALVMGTDLPVAVEQSTAGLIDFAKTQLTATSETSDPLAVGDAKLATDESSEPSEV